MFAENNEELMLELDESQQPEKTNDNDDDIEEMLATQLPVKRTQVITLYYFKLNLNL